VGEIKRFWNIFKSSPMPKQFYAKIGNKRVFFDGKYLPALASERLQNRNFYFDVQIDEMYIKNLREYYIKYAPMVSVASEFIYDDKKVSVPYVVGPSLMEKYDSKRQPPAGMIYSKIRVVGLHPCQGDELRLAVVLFKNETKNYAKEVLGLIEKTSKAFPISSMLTSYLQLSNILVDGIELICEMGKTQPIIGRISDYEAFMS
jgi:hypothetical protein